MKKCNKCGSKLSNSLKYCPYCGTLLGRNIKKENQDNEPDDIKVGYKVVLLSKGSCTIKQSKELLHDILGYSLNTARELLEEIPVEIADELTARQAVVLAQTLSEYGLDVTVVDEYNTYIDFSNLQLTSVFDDNGYLMSSAVTILSTLDASNRVHRYRKYRKTNIFNIMFIPRYHRSKPKNVRQTISLDPEPNGRVTINKNNLY